MFKLPTFGKIFKEGKQQASGRRKKVSGDIETTKKRHAEAGSTHEHEERDVRPALVLQGETSLAYVGLKSPLLTEKSERLKARENKYVFKVAPDATKGLVRHAVEALYNVKVTDVNMARTAGKTVRRGRTIGHKSGVKKAVVTIREGQTINIGI